MRSFTIGWTVGCSLAVFFGAAAAQAPTALDLNCHPRRIDLEAAIPSEEYWVPRYPNNVTADVASLEVTGQWDAAVRYIVELFRPTEEVGKASPNASLFQAAEEFRDTVESRLQAARARGVMGATKFIVQETPVGPTDPQTFTVLDQTLSIGENDGVETQRSNCWLAHSLRRYHDRLNAPGRWQSELELRERVARWDTFNDRGLTPYPWELVLNEFVGWFGSRAPLEPPQVQLIALRPSAAVELESDFDNRTNVAAVEVLGFVVYINDRKWYLGASLLWTSPTESTTGLGVLFHLLPWLKGGPVWRDVDLDGQRDDFRWTLSVDAFDLFKGAPQILIDAARNATNGRAGN